MNEKITPTVINKIMDRALLINQETPEFCCDFEIMTSSIKKDVLILRFITVDISDIERPKQCYRYECFELDGTPQMCSIHYSNQKEANDFFWSLTSLYHQKYAIDHKL